MHCNQSDVHLFPVSPASGAADHRSGQRLDSVRPGEKNKKHDWHSQEYLYHQITGEHGSNGASTEGNIPAKPSSVLGAKLAECEESELKILEQEEEREENNWIFCVGAELAAELRSLTK